MTNPSKNAVRARKRGGRGLGAFGGVLGDFHFEPLKRTTFALTATRSRAEALLGILEECFTLVGVPGTGLVDQVGPGARVVSTLLH